MLPSRDQLRFLLLGRHKNKNLKIPNIRELFQVTGQIMNIFATHSILFGSFFFFFFFLLQFQKHAGFLEEKQTSKECCAIGPLIISFIFRNCGRFW